MNENEANKQYFTIIRCIAHLGDWTTHSMTKTSKLAKIDFQTACYTQKKNHTENAGIPEYQYGTTFTGSST